MKLKDSLQIENKKGKILFELKENDVIWSRDTILLKSDWIKLKYIRSKNSLENSENISTGFEIFVTAVKMDKLSKYRKTWLWDLRQQAAATLGRICSVMMDSNNVTGNEKIFKKFFFNFDIKNVVWTVF
ncbi:hypothetical protein MHBO_000188 [Bonamia ostreae]|uniref:Uncharacterized protein n=1 Tax=Bonamia ostreae TaxID=126728 RepID=A0ABV2AES0_9EUKA